MKSPKMATALLIAPVYAKMNPLLFLNMHTNLRSIMHVSFKEKLRKKEDDMQALFWIPGDQRALYTRFHQVLIHDNTYSSNKFDSPLSVFTGINQFGNSQLLGQVLEISKRLYPYAYL